MVLIWGSGMAAAREECGGGGERRCNKQGGGHWTQNVPSMKVFLNNRCARYWGLGLHECSSPEATVRREYRAAVHLISGDVHTFTCLG